MSSKTLAEVPIFCSAYWVFGVESDGELCTKMASIGLIYTCVVGLYSIFLPAPYGRYQTASFGPTINARLGWMIQECMAFFVPIVVVLWTPSLHVRNYMSNAVPLGLFLVHYFHRSFIYPFATSSASKPTPLITVINAMLFCSYNGLLQGLHLANVAVVDDSIHGFTGTIMFMTGMAINITHDRMLIALRRQTDTDEAEGTSRRYKIPRGGLFEYISGANYFGEIVEWIGFAVMTRQYPQVVFSLFTTVFLGIRAVHHHNFYKRTFGNSYPQERKAIIPFIL